MKNKNRTVVGLIIFFILGIPVWLSGRQDVDEILTKLEKKINSTETVSCRFSQVKSLPQLKGLVKTTGKLYFKKPHFLRMEMEGDENLIIYVNGEKIWLEDLDLEEVEVYDFEDFGAEEQMSRFLPPVFVKSAADLKRLFSIIIEEIPKRETRLEFIPKPSSGFSFVKLQVDIDDLSRMTGLRIHYGGGDRMDMSFHAWNKHPEISDHFFAYLK